MYRIGPARTDLVDEFRQKPHGPHSPDLTLVVNPLRLMPIPERHVLVRAKRGREWVLARIPAERGQPVQLIEDQIFDD